MASVLAYLSQRLTSVGVSIKVFVSDVVVLVGIGIIFVDSIVQVVLAVAHAPRPKQRGEHDTLIHRECVDLLLKFDEGLLLFGELPAASDVLHLVVVEVVQAVELVARLLLCVVQVLHRVYYLPQFNGELLLPRRYLVQLPDLLLILLVDAFFVLADFVEVVGEGLASQLENFAHVQVDVRLYVFAHFFYQLVVPPAFFYLFG